MDDNSLVSFSANDNSFNMKGDLASYEFTGIRDTSFFLRDSMFALHSEKSFSIGSNNSNPAIFIAQPLYSVPTDSSFLCFSLRDKHFNLLWQKYYFDKKLVAQQVYTHSLRAGNFIVSALQSDTTPNGNNFTILLKILPDGFVSGLSPTVMARTKSIVYPNPGLDLIHIDQSLAVSIIFYDISGKSSQIYRDEDGNFYTGELDPGLYFYRVIDGKRSSILSSGKWIKE